MMEVIKRNGKTVPFDESRIYKAIFDAARACDWDPDDANDLALHTTMDLVVRWEQAGPPGEPVDIEVIQDNVESELEAKSPEVYRRFHDYRQQKAELRAAQPDPSAISDYILHSKYLRDGESWDDCVDRCRDMHLRKFWGTGNSLADRIFTAFEFVREKRVLPSMRSLQFGGAAIEAHHARMYNCSFSLVDRVRFFKDAFYLLLCGCGVGYSVQHRHVSKLPEVSSPHEERVIFHRVGDTIEGWAGALDTLLQSYFEVGLSFVDFDYTEIRRRGSNLVTTGGKAPGHLPLKRMLEKVRTLMDSCVGRQMTSFEAHRLVCMIAEAVLSGGIRRSSLICLFDRWDTQMLYAKIGDWYDEYPELAMANNSAVFPRDPDSESGSHAHWTEVFNAMRQYGEPGFFLTNDLDHGTNPCGEIGLDPVLRGTDEEALAAGLDPDEVRTGFSFCNLTEINGALVTNQKELEECARVAAFIGTLQAAYTQFGFDWDRTGLGISQAIALRDALLGVSITGIVDMPRLDLRKAANAAVDENKQTAIMLGRNPAKRVTTVKPSGTASLVLGAIGSGCHTHHAKRYLRRVTANPMEPAFRSYLAANPTACEKKPNGDYVIEFPIEARGTCRHEEATLEMLERVKQLYEDWVLPGTNEGRLTHNVSATINVRDSEWERVRDWCWVHQDSLAALSFLSEVGDRAYLFAPRYEVVTPADIARWKELCSSYTPPSYSGGVSDFGLACEGPSCEL